jgi:peptide chain release factor 2
VENEALQKRIEEIEAAMQAPDFWSVPEKAQTLIKELHELKAQAEGGSKYDRGGAVLSMVAGAGGDDAEDFAYMLFEMYRKYFEKRGWDAHVLHENKNDHGGFRNISI